jgi:hypothetical protein
VGELFDIVRRLVLSGRYLVGLHAVERLDERGILEWQVVDGIENGKLLVERPEALPNPTVEIQQLLPDGTSIWAVWLIWQRLTLPS